VIRADGSLPPAVFVEAENEKVGRDVGLRTACIDFLENMEQAHNEYRAYKPRTTLNAPFSSLERISILPARPFYLGSRCTVQNLQH
jgi:hypothetical protein